MAERRYRLPGPGSAQGRTVTFPPPWSPADAQRTTAAVPCAGRSPQRSSARRPSPRARSCPLPWLGAGGDAARGTPSAYDRAAELRRPGPHARCSSRCATACASPSTSILPRDLAPGARLPALLHQGRYWRSVVPPRARPADLRLGGAPRPARAVQGGLRPARLRLARRRHAGLGRLLRHPALGLLAGGDPGRRRPRRLDRAPAVVGRAASRASASRTAARAAELLLANQHPAVKAALPLFCDFDQYQDILAPGGVPQRAWLEAWGDFTRRLDRGRAARSTPGGSRSSCAACGRWTEDRGARAARRGAPRPRRQLRLRRPAARSSTATTVRCAGRRERGATRARGPRARRRLARRPLRPGLPRARHGPREPPRLRGAGVRRSGAPGVRLQRLARRRLREGGRAALHARFASPATSCCSAPGTTRSTP